MQSATARRPAPSMRPDSLAAYFGDIRSYPLLTRREEEALVRRVRKGDHEAADRLVCSNLRFVVSVAKRYRHYGVPLGDLVNEGNLGLIRAVEKFDDTRGVRFISYAVWWIRQAIRRALAESRHPIRVPLSRNEEHTRIRRQAALLLQESGREPLPHELAESLGLTEEDVISALWADRPLLSLDAPLGTDDSTQLQDRLPDETEAPPDETVSVEGQMEAVREALTRLRDREARVLRLYFGFDGREPLTLAEIGTEMGITRERVRQIKEKALSRLRKSGSVNALDPRAAHS